MARSVQSYSFWSPVRNFFRPYILFLLFVLSEFLLKFVRFSHVRRIVLRLLGFRNCDDFAFPEKKNLPLKDSHFRALVLRISFNLKSIREWFASCPLINRCPSLLPHEFHPLRDSDSHTDSGSLEEVARVQFAPDHNGGGHSGTAYFSQVPCLIPHSATFKKPFTIVLDLDETLICAYNAYAVPPRVFQNALRNRIRWFHLECGSSLPALPSPVLFEREKKGVQERSGERGNPLAFSNLTEEIETVSAECTDVSSKVSDHTVALSGDTEQNDEIPGELEEGDECSCSLDEASGECPAGESTRRCCTDSTGHADRTSCTELKNGAKYTDLPDCANSTVNVSCTEIAGCGKSTESGPRVSGCAHAAASGEGERGAERKGQFWERRGVREERLVERRAEGGEKRGMFRVKECASLLEDSGSNPAFTHFPPSPTSSSSPSCNATTAAKALLSPPNSGNLCESDGNYSPSRSVVSNSAPTLNGTLTVSSTGTLTGTSDRSGESGLPVTGNGVNPVSESHSQQKPPARAGELTIASGGKNRNCGSRRCIYSPSLGPFRLGRKRVGTDQERCLMDRIVPTSATCQEKIIGGISADGSAQHAPLTRHPNPPVARLVVFERPGLSEFLRSCSEFAELVIFTAGLEGYASPLVDHIDPDRRISKRLYRDSTSNIKFRDNVKDLRVLHSSLSRTVLVDNNPFSFLLQPNNGIPCSSFTAEQSDNELLTTVLPLLRQLSLTLDVRPFLSDLYDMPLWYQSKGICMRGCEGGREREEKALIEGGGLAEKKERDDKLLPGLSPIVPVHIV